MAVAVVTAAGCVCAAVTQAGPAAAAPAATASGTESVIVVLKDQLATLPATRTRVSARRGAAHSAQATVLARLRGAKPTQVVNYTVGNAFSATVSADQAAQLAADPAVASVVPNRKVEVTPTTSTSTSPKVSRAAASGPAVSPTVCSTDPTKPQLEPEALQTINASSSNPSAKTAAALGITGAGVKVAYIADGINPENKGFLRTNGKSSIIDYQDFYGDGPSAPTSGAEAFGDASAISAQGNVVYDVADYANPGAVTFPGGHCYIKIVGVAPGSDVVALKAGSELLPNSAILQAIDYAVSVAHVDVINQSFGANLYPDSGARNTIQLFDDQAVKAGVTVVASTGDAGTTSTIGNPATDPNLISAGATTDSRLYEQTGYALATQFGNGTWQDSNISSLSSAGITQDGRTIDVSAPGEADWAVCDDGGNFVGCTSFGNPAHPLANIQAFGGTSQSAPITSGVAALVIQAYRKTHGATSPTPALVKQIITSTAHDLGLPGDEQGSGLIDARAAVEAALTWPGGSGAVPAGVGSNIAVSTDQLTISGQPGSTKTGSFTVTNVGTKPQSVVVNSRKYATLSTATQSTTIDTTSPQTLTYPTTGAPWVYKKLTFSVPGGADELGATIRWQSGADYGGAAGPVVRLTLIAPDGAYAGNSRPQGGAAPANYGLVTIKHPAAGTWTAILYTPVTGGFTGTVGLQAQAFRALPVGTVTPTLTTLAPGASATVKVKLPVPSVGGDTVDTISIGSSGGHQTAVPVIVRAVVPTASGSGDFAGTITGGNARALSPAQTFSYSFNVPKGKRDLDVSVALKDKATLLEGFLVDPDGEVQSINSNQPLGPSLTMQNTVADPVAGNWRYVIEVVTPVSGQAFSQTFTGRVTFDKVQVAATAVPSSLKAGKTVTGKITVTNRGAAPMIIGADPRAGAARTLQLSPQFAGSTLQLPQSVDDLSQLPAYLVPPDTSAVSVSASTTSPAQVELSSSGGGIDLFGDLQSARNGDTVSTATVSETRGPVGIGLWGVYVQQIGPFSDAGAPSATSVLTATAVTRPIDTAVTTSTGNPFAPAFDASADGGAPIVIAPGHSATITVHITPTGKAGKVVSGVLNLVTPPLAVANTFYTTGEVLASIPYRYTVS
jgi:hypothetical protein